MFLSRYAQHARRLRPRVRRKPYHRRRPHHVGCPTNPRRAIQISVRAAALTMLLEFGTSVLTGSVSLASDAAESAVNLVAGLVADLPPKN
jgi:Co/Zn/Cd efflux system component